MGTHEAMNHLTPAVGLLSVSFEPKMVPIVVLFALCALAVVVFLMLVTWNKIRRTVLTLLSGLLCVIATCWGLIGLFAWRLGDSPRDFFEGLHQGYFLLYAFGLGGTATLSSWTHTLGLLTGMAAAFLTLSGLSRLALILAARRDK